MASLIIIPLHNYSCRDGRRHEIIAGYIYLEKFIFNRKKLRFDEHVENCGMFSRYDYNSINRCTWALCIRKDNPRGREYGVDVNLFVLALFLANPSAVYIQHHLDPSTYHHGNYRENMPMMYWYGSADYTTYTNSELAKAKIMYKRVRETYDASWHTRRSLWFLYQQTTTHQWVAKYILLSCALEHLFSIEREESHSEKICQRVHSYIGHTCMVEIRDWYRIRSDLVHGRYQGRLDDAKDNTERIKKLEEWARSIFIKMLSRRDYNMYAYKTDRYAFLDAIVEYCPSGIVR